MPANDVHELIAWLKVNSNMATAGISTSGIHILAAFFQKRTGSQFTLERIVEVLLRGKTLLRVRLTRYSMGRIRYRWCEAGA
jgi:hypothetical protein